MWLPAPLHNSTRKGVSAAPVGRNYVHLPSSLTLAHPSHANHLQLQQLLRGRQPGTAWMVLRPQRLQARSTVVLSLRHEQRVPRLPVLALVQCLGTTIT